MKLLLAVDVGNSRVKFGVFDRSRIAADASGLPECFHSLAAALNEPPPWDGIRGWADQAAWNGAGGVIAGSNPQGVEAICNSWPAWFTHRPVIVQEAASLPLSARVDAPDRVGIDRLLNAVAANRVRPPHRAAIIVDTGTATTVDVVAADGVFEGGAILPGFELAARSLNRYTALLPLIPIEELASSIPEPLGKNTRLAVRSGLFWGQLGAVNELISRLSKPQGISDAATTNQHASAKATEQPLLLLTGGGAGLLKEHLPAARWEPNLSLQGLAVASAHCA